MTRSINFFQKQPDLFISRVILPWGPLTNRFDLKSAILNAAPTADIRNLAEKLDDMPWTRPERFLNHVNLKESVQRDAYPQLRKRALLNVINILRDSTGSRIAKKSEHANELSNEFHNISCQLLKCPDLPYFAQDFVILLTTDLARLTDSPRNVKEDPQWAIDMMNTLREVISSVPYLLRTTYKSFFFDSIFKYILHSGGKEKASSCISPWLSKINDSEITSDLKSSIIRVAQQCNFDQCIPYLSDILESYRRGNMDSQFLLMGICGKFPEVFRDHLDALFEFSSAVSKSFLKVYNLNFKKISIDYSHFRTWYSHHYHQSR